MEEINRRGFLASVFPALAVAPVLPLVVIKPAAAEQDEGALTCRWIEGLSDCPANHALVVAREKTIARHGPTSATADLVLWHNGGDNWQCRFGQNHRVFQATSLETARRLAEQQFVEWLKAMLVEAERFAFRLNRS